MLHSLVGRRFGFVSGRTLEDPRCRIVDLLRDAFRCSEAIVRSHQSVGFADLGRIQPMQLVLVVDVEGRAFPALIRITS